MFMKIIDAASMPIRYLLIIILAGGFVLTNESCAQSDSSTENNTGDYFSKKIKVTAGKDFNISGFSEIFLGEHWRKLWTTPFEAGVLDMKKFAKGLTPYKRGGGLQTKSLRFKGNDGKTYKFRSIDKDPRRILPPDLQESIFADAFKDQISTSHPLSALIVAPMLNEVGILNAEPIVVILPDDESLGEYRKDFGNVLGTFEENPDDGSDGEKGFGESDKIVNSFKLYEKLEKNNDNQVDRTEFLKARLMDLMIGDWDRHSDQWLWAGYKNGGKTVYKPIPRDRDQAFSLYDGLLPFIAGESITQIEGYKKDYPKIYDLSFNGRYVDRRFLPGVEKKIYDSLTAFIQNKITDEAITNAVKRMPEEWYRMEGDHLTELIRSRRDKLKDASDELYDLINETVDIYGSDKDEIIEINNISGDRIEIQLFEKDKDTGSKKKNPFFERTFDSKDTKEIRLYLNKGKDIINVSGADNSGISIKAIYGKEKIKINGDKTNQPDIYKDTRSTSDAKERFEPLVEDRGYDWRFGPGFGYNSDDGIILGGGPILYKYGFRSKPYVYRMSLIGSYAFGAKSYSIKYTGDFYSIIKGVRILLNVEKTELDITRFYGTGNETQLIDSLDVKDFYKVGQELVLISPSFEIPISGKVRFSLSPFYKYSDVSYDENTFLGQNPMTRGLGSQKYLGVSSVIGYDSRDNRSEPYKGIFAQLGGSVTPAIFKNNTAFSKAGFDIRAYVSTDTVKGLTFAVRGAGGKVWGTYPFYESMFLGGINSLKGFSRERFAGDEVLLGQSEIRLRIARVNLLIPGMLGVSLFGGAGKVFVEGETSKRWHSSYGGSVWITYLNRMFNVGLTVAKSDEGYKYFFGTALFL